MSDIKVPGLGPVPKKWFIIVGAGSVLVIGYVVIRRKSAASSASATADTGTGTAALAGQPCVDANGNPGVYDDTGTCQVDTSALGGYYAGTGALGVSGTTPPVPGTGGFTTNGQWAQQAITDMQSLGTGVDVGTLTAALGAYIAGSPVTTDQQSLIDQAIAIEGYPPVAGPSGYPPAIKLGAPSGGQTQTPGTCASGFTYSDSNPGTAGVVPASGGTGYCVPNPATGGGGTTAAAKPPTVTGLHAESETRTSIKLGWNASKGATSYQVRVTYQGPATPVQTHTVTGTSYTVTGLGANRTYGLHVVAIGPGGWAPEASIDQKTLN